MTTIDSSALVRGWLPSRFNLDCVFPEKPHARLFMVNECMSRSRLRSP